MPTASPRRLSSLALAAWLAGALGGPAAAQTEGAETTDGDAAAAAEQPAAEQPAADAEAAAAETPAASAPQPAQQPPALEVVRTDGDWTTACTTGEPRQCVMRQVGRMASGEEILEMSIRRIEPQQTQQGTVEALINVRTPLGVLLREGLSIQIDSAQPQVGQFVLCAADGCLLREPLPNSLVDAMKKGAAAKLAFAVPQGNQAARIEADISLTGFTA
ncbi:MAG: invasion associated locus B family protein, partial [Pseudomonadota bacterium]